MELRCAFCHGEAGETDPCEECGTLLHTECWAAVDGACPTLGCEPAPLEERIAGRWAMLVTVLACMFPVAIVTRRTLSHFLFGVPRPWIVDVRPPDDPTVRPGEPLHLVPSDDGVSQISYGPEFALACSVSNS